MLFAVGGEFMAIEAAQKFDLDDTKENRNFFGVIALMTYLYHDACFRGKKTYVPKILALFMHAKVRQLADLVPFQRFIIDPERREELVRLCLDGVGSAPEGETSAMAKDRLNTLDSVERERLIRKTREAQERAKQLREAMERQAAEEAASKMTRE
jgi:hypothetical protein